MGTGPIADERLRLLRALLDDPAAPEADEISELYSEILELCANDPERLSQVRELGAKIDELSRSDLLPRTFVRRGPSRRD